MFRDLIPELADRFRLVAPDLPGFASQPRGAPQLPRETTRWQYTHGVPDATAISPDGYSLDNFYLARHGAAEIQLDLFGDYKSNVVPSSAMPDSLTATTLTGSEI
jgi:pimeloyl-ACP methyl ester carboxylesterase